MFLSYQYRLYPFPVQIDALHLCRAEMTFLWNHALAQRRDAWAKRRERVSYLDQQNDLKNWRAFDTGGLGRVAYDIARDCLQRLDLAFRDFFRHVQAGERPGYPRFRRETHSFSFIPRSDSICLGPHGTTRLRVPNVGEVPVRLHRPLPNGSVVKWATLLYYGGAWFVNIVVALPDPPPPPQTRPHLAVGIDLGVVRLATLSTGAIIPAPVSPTADDRRLGRLNQGLARKLRGSGRFVRQRERIARLHARIRRRRLWRNHQLSSDWAEHFDLVAFEDLDAARLIEENRLAHQLTHAAWGELRDLTAYKMAIRSKRCVEVPTEGTTQECSGCGRRADPPLSVADRVYSCKCGVRLDRDLNAARNILARGLTLLDQELRRSSPEVKREEGGPPASLGGRRVYQRSRVAPRNREQLTRDRPRKGGDGRSVGSPRRPER